MNKKAISLLTAIAVVLSLFPAAMAQKSYSDVADGAPYAEAVEFCREQGLMEGISETEFSPDDSTSRAMLVTILHRNEGSPSTNGSAAFTDVENGSWYYDAVAWASNTGIVQGYDSEHFGPQDTLTKEQILSVLWRLDGGTQTTGVSLPYTDNSTISAYAVNAVSWAYANGIIDNERETLVPQGTVTRADMAVILFRYITAQEPPPSPSPTPVNPSEPGSPSRPAEASADVHVRFGNTEFDVVLYASTTKELLMSQLSESEMLLPTSYDLDNVCKYYDIPSRYLSYMGIETGSITQAHAGDLLISDEGRLFLYYEDAAVTGSFMRIGYVKDMTGIAEALGHGSISFYVSQHAGSEDDSEPVSDPAVNLDGSITQLEDGFSAVRFEGDDFFDAFLAQGGAASDAAVIRFLEEKLGSGSEGLRLETGGFACSTLSADGANGGRLFGRNFDWYRCNALVTVSSPASGYASIATVNTDFIKTVYRNGFDSLPDRVRTLVSLYAPLDGMNEKGLCAAVLMIQDSEPINQSSEKPDITTTTAVRMLLNHAATVDEAVAMLRGYDFHSSFGYTLHFALSDATGKSVAVEYIGNEMVVTETPVLTNFYVAEGSKNGIGTVQSHTRFETLQTALSQDAVMTAQQMKNALERVSKRHFNDGETTEWSIVYDQLTGTAYYYHRENFEKAYPFQIS